VGECEAEGVSADGPLVSGVIKNTTWCKPAPPSQPTAKCSHFRLAGHLPSLCGYPDMLHTGFLVSSNQSVTQLGVGSGAGSSVVPTWTQLLVREKLMRGEHSLSWASNSNSHYTINLKYQG